MSDLRNRLPGCYSLYMQCKQIIFFLQNVNADKKEPIFVQGSNLRIQIMSDCLEFSIQTYFWRVFNAYLVFT